MNAPAVTLGQPGLSFRYVQTFGVTEEAYPADTHYLNSPDGLFIDGSDNLFVVEWLGNRLLKYQLSNKANLLSIGKAGLLNRDTYTFDYPKDVILDSGGNIWAVDNQRAVEYNPTGTFIQEFPSADPWHSGSDNSHFHEPRSIAFDSAGRMYIADRYNHRIQVYDMSGPSPVYSATLGVTGESGTDSAHFNEPVYLAFDGTGRLYVMDKSNYRVQRCAYAVGAWTCTTFFGETGVPGNDVHHLAPGWTNGLAIKGSDLYIADTVNNRVLKCNLSGACGLFVGASDGASGTDSSHLYSPDDVAVDSAGNVYVSDLQNSRIQKFTSSGGAAVDTLGTTQVPYVPDASRYNTPYGVAVGSDGSLITTEYAGFRLAKINAAGVQQWTVGQAGIYGSDNTHFGDGWDGPVAVAVSGSGSIYVADTGNHRVQKCTSDGTSCLTLLGVSGESGSDNTHFDRPSGIALDGAGNIYVGDQNNHRIQKCTPAGVCTTLAGVTGVSGADNTHFNGPMGVTVDGSGNMYVADAWNKRVQKCSAGGSCSTFAGVTGVWGDDFAHFGEPRDVAVDAAGRVYVADIGNNRVQVFDATGAYLTTIGGSYGSRSGELRNPAGVDVDNQGNVYVTDSTNGRIQKFAPGVPGWKQANINGFGDWYNGGVTALEVFSSTLYAGASNWDDGGSIWRSTDARTWTQVTQPGFGNTYTNTNPAIIDMVVFNGQLYAGTGWDSAAGQLWRSSTGTAWEQVVGDGFGDADNGAINAMAVYSGTLYVGTGNANRGSQIWRSSSGDNLSWTNVVTSGLSCGDCRNVSGLIVFNGSLYAAVEAHTEPLAGMQIWRTTNGSDWSQVGATGFGSTANYETGGFAVFNGYLYVGTHNDATGGQLWRSSDGTAWSHVPVDGFGDLNNTKIESPFVNNGYLYAGTQNGVTGVEIWRSADGLTWSQINPDGFGDSNNIDTTWSSSTASFNGSLFIGTWNWGGSSGEVWQMLHQVYLPVVLRN